MQYWWVSQNQTFDLGFAGGYFWSPKKKSNGHYRQSYENMRLMRKGDIVFSCKNKQIVAISVVTKEHYDEEKPEDFESSENNWDKIGWRVDASYTKISNVIEPKQYIDQIRPLLPHKNSPLNSDGVSQEAYMSEISYELADLLVELIGGEARSVFNKEWKKTLSDDDRKIIEDKSISETESTQIIKARKGQGTFKENVHAIEKQCRLTGVSDIKHLIASHIKPWKNSTNTERLDGNNGLLLSPHVDHLFDKGYISFSHTGELIVSPVLNNDIRKRWDLEKNYGKNKFNKEQKTYLKYHREHIFKK